MHSEVLSCCICLVDFDKGNHTPKSLPCGHTICLACLTGILQKRNFTCPLDRKLFPSIYSNIDAFPTNIIILQLLDEKSTTQYELCTNHNQPKDLICFTDKCKVCKYCAEYSDHKGHSIMPITDAKEKARQKTQKLDEIIREFDNDCKSLQDLVEEKKKVIMKTAERRFGHLRQLIDVQFQKVRSEIDCIYGIEKSIIKNKLHLGFEVKKVFQKRITQLNSQELNEDFMKALRNERITELSAKAEFQQLEEASNTINSKFEIALEEFETLVGPLIEGFRLEFPFDLENFFDLKEQNGWLILSPVTTDAEEIAIMKEKPAKVEWKKAKSVCFQFRKNKPSKESIQTLRYIWREFPELSDINFDVSKLALTDHELMGLCFHNFWEKEKMLGFGLNINGCKGITDQSVVKIVNEIMSGMKNLKNLYLNFGETQITDKTIEALSDQVIPALTVVEKLQLYLPQTNVTDASIEKLSISMEKIIKNVQIFEMNLISTKITDRSVKAFINNALPEMNYVKDLKLYLYQTGITDRSVQDLCQVLQTSLKNLACFVLNLDLTQITDYSGAAINDYLLTFAPPMRKLEIYLNHTQMSEEYKRRIANAQEYLVSKSI